MSTVSIPPMIEKTETMDELAREERIKELLHSYKKVNDCDVAAIFPSMP